MLTGNLAHQGEAEPGPGCRAGGPIKGGENPLAVAWRNSRTVVRNQHCRAWRLGPDLDHDWRPPVLLGVVEQIAHHALQQAAVTAHEHRLAADRAMLVARGLFGGNSEQVDLLAAVEAAHGIEPTGQ